MIFALSAQNISNLDFIATKWLEIWSRCGCGQFASINHQTSHIKCSTTLGPLSSVCVCVCVGGACDWLSVCLSSCLSRILYLNLSLSISLFLFIVPSVARHLHSQATCIFGDAFSDIIIHSHRSADMTTTHTHTHCLTLSTAKCQRTGSSRAHGNCHVNQICKTCVK